MSCRIQKYKLLLVKNAHKKSYWQRKMQKRLFSSKIVLCMFFFNIFFRGHFLLGKVYIFGFYVKFCVFWYPISPHCEKSWPNLPFKNLKNRSLTSTFWWQFMAPNIDTHRIHLKELLKRFFEDIYFVRLNLDTCYLFFIPPKILTLHIGKYEYNPVFQKPNFDTQGYTWNNS